jgi:hypothetical protein
VMTTFPGCRSQPSDVDASLFAVRTPATRQLGVRSGQRDARVHLPGEHDLRTAWCADARTALADTPWRLFHGRVDDLAELAARLVAFIGYTWGSGDGRRPWGRGSGGERPILRE